LQVNMFLADAAEVSNGKLYALGMGWNVTGPGPSRSAIVAIFEVPWDRANMKHRFAFELLDADGNAVTVEDGGPPIRLDGEFGVGRPPDVKPGTPFNVPLAVNIDPFPLMPGQRFVWRLSIDGQSEPDWRLTFLTRPAAPPQQLAA
jgi:hypothetical protein